MEEKACLVDGFEDLSIESMGRCIQGYIWSAMKRVTSTSPHSESRYRECQDSRLLDLLERRRRLARILEANVRNGTSRADFVKRFKEYRSVKSAISVR